MTIAIGILCSDGIVLSADSQESFNEYAKLQRAKVFELELIHPDVKVVVAGSGDSNFYDALRERLEDGIDLANPDLLSIRAKIEEVIVEYCKKIWPVYGSQRDRPTAQMLIGIRATDGLALIHTDGPIAKRSNNTECIGFGADFSMYHLNRLFRDARPLAEATPVAVYVLALAKENVEFCGGDSHVFIIPTEGDVEKKSEEYITENTDTFRSLAQTVDGVLARAPSLRMHEAKYLHSLLDFYESEPDDYRSVKPEEVEKIRQTLKALEGIKDAQVDQAELAFANLVKEHGGIAKAIWALLEFYRKVITGEIERPKDMIKFEDEPH